MTDHKIRRPADICPGTVFIGSQSMPHQVKPKQRPFLAIRQVQGQIVALPFTCLSGKTPREVCVKHHRKASSYYPVAPNINDGSSYDPISVNGKSGYIDLITPTTFGTSTIAWEFKAQLIPKESLDRVLNAHHLLMGTTDVSLQLTPLSRHIILKLGNDILQASRAEVLNKQDTEKMVLEIIAACEVLPPSPGPSSVASSENGAKAVGASVASVTCKEKYLPARKPEDDQSGGDGSYRGAKWSGRNGRSRGRGNRQARGTGGRSTATGSSKPQEAVECVEASSGLEYGSKEWTDVSWEFVDSDQEQVDTIAEFGDLEWTWELLDSESEIDDMDLSGESNSGLSSPVADRPTDITGWLKDLEDDIIHSEITEPPLAVPPISNMEEALTDQTQYESTEWGLSKPHVVLLAHLPGLTIWAVPCDIQLRTKKKKTRNPIVSCSRLGRSGFF